MPRPAILLIPLAALALGGCVRTIADVVTAPVKAGAKVVDWATVSNRRLTGRGRIETTFSSAARTALTAISRDGY